MIGLWNDALQIPGGQRGGMFSAVHPPTHPTHSGQVGPLWPWTIKNTVATMPKPTAALAVALCCLASFSTLAAAQQLDQIAWLAGCWVAENGEPGSIEVWMPPTGGTMLGLGRTVKGGKTVEHEFMQIRHAADGKLIYVALPSRQKETTFVLKALSERDVVFENLEHDFPHRVMYRLLADGRLAARIEGTLKGAPRGIDFPMRRAHCDTELKNTWPR